MIFFPNRPEPTEDLCGLMYIPEDLDYDFHEGPDEDEFIKLLIEVMNKPLKGGQHG